MEKKTKNSDLLEKSLLSLVSHIILYLLILFSAIVF